MVRLTTLANAIKGSNSVKLNLPCLKPNIPIKLPSHGEMQSHEFKEMFPALNGKMYSYTEENITTTHAALIEGITAIFDTLKLMEYVSEDDIARPPHSLDDIPWKALLRQGLDPETVCLSRYLPYLMITEEVTMHSRPYSYLSRYKSGGDAPPARLEQKTRRTCSPIGKRRLA
jgi:hypothetical protein